MTLVYRNLVCTWLLKLQVIWCYDQPTWRWHSSTWADTHSRIISDKCMSTMQITMNDFSSIEESFIPYSKVLIEKCSLYVLLSDSRSRGPEPQQQHTNEMDNTFSEVQESWMQRRRVKPVSNTVSNFQLHNFTSWYPGETDWIQPTKIWRRYTKHAKTPRCWRTKAEGTHRDGVSSLLIRGKPYLEASVSLNIELWKRARPRSWSAYRRDCPVSKKDLRGPLLHLLWRPQRGMQLPQ